MKNKTHKVLIFVSLFVLLSTLLVIPSFADAGDGYFVDGEEFIFNERLDPNLFLGTPQSFSFQSRGTSFTSISCSYRGYLVVYYDDIEVYNNGWVDDEWRYITSSGNQFISYDLKSFLLLNQQSNSMYDNLYHTIGDAIYGSRTLNETETFTLSLICTLFCVAVVALPLILVFWLIKFIFTLGREW